MTYWIISLMERTGLAWNVVHKTAIPAGTEVIEFPGEDEATSQDAA